MTDIFVVSRGGRPAIHRKARPSVPEGANVVPSRRQLAWLRRGRDAPGGKLPLFTPEGQEVPRGVIEGCLDAGWAEPWFSNPIKPDWLVCRLTPAGAEVLARLSRD
jgi:hypothetical protein